MITKKYSVQKKYSGKIIPLRQINWKNRGRLLFRHFYEQNSGGQGDRDVYSVVGFKQSENKTVEKIDYQVSPIPLKLQRKCRAFLRGTGRETDIGGLDKIVFVK